MKKLILIIVCLLSFSGRGQGQDTIFANEHFNVALFFPEKIRQAVVGADNFVFSYNQEHPQFFGLLKGSTGTSSNLLAITQDGKVYSFIVEYKKELPRLNYFLNDTASVGNEQPLKVIEKVMEVNSSTTLKDSIVRINYLQKLSGYYSSNSSGKLKAKKTDGIMLQVNEMIYHGDNVFIIFEVANRSEIEFQPDYLRVFLSRGNRKRNASYQKLIKDPVFRYKFPKSIIPGQRKRFVYVLPKFTIGKKEKIVVELREKKGNRLINIKFKK